MNVLIAASVPSRGVLLREQAAHLERLSRFRFSFLRQLGSACLLVLLAGSVAIAGTELVRPETWVDASERLVGLTVAALFGALAVPLAFLASRGMRRSAVARRDLVSWRLADRRPEMRALPAGDVPRGMRTPYDARADADFDDVARAALGASESATWGAQLLSVVWLPMLGAVVGTIIVVGLAMDELNRQTPVGLVAAAIILVPSVVHLAALVEDHFGRTGEWAWLADDVVRIGAWRSRVIVDSPPSEVRRRARDGWLAAGLSLLALSGLLRSVASPVVAGAVLAVSVVVLVVASRRVARDLAATRLCRELAAETGREASAAAWIDTTGRCDGSSVPAAVAVRDSSLVVWTGSGANEWPWTDFVALCRLDSPLAPRRGGVAFIRDDGTSVSLLVDDPRVLMGAMDAIVGKRPA